MRLFVCGFISVDYDRLCPGGPGYRPNGVSAVLEGNLFICFFILLSVSLLLH